MNKSRSSILVEVSAEPHMFKMHVNTAFIRVSTLTCRGGDLCREPCGQDVPSLGGGIPL